MRLWASACLTSSLTAEMIASLERMPPELAAPAIVGMLRHPVVITPEAENNRARLLAAAHLLDRVTLSTDAAVASVNAWMQCSYAPQPDKHRLKVTLNGAYARYLRHIGVTGTADPPARAIKDRPTLLVCAESLGSYHIMYRCYAAFLRQLASRFRIVLMAQAADVDAAARALGEEFIAVERDIRAAHARVARLQPDLIYYPSLGMRAWTILLANLRLAPIQFMTLGHPASSFSPHLDYVVLGGDQLGDPAAFSEKLILLAAPGSVYGPHVQDPMLEPRTRANPGALRVAVPARSYKVSSAFVAACRRIAAASAKPLLFEFFPNEMPHHHLAFADVLGAELPSSRVYPRTAYRNYMSWLNDCDLALSCFPFGNSGSTIDALCLGLPVVAGDGPEPHSRTDRRVMRAAGMPEWLLARDADGFVATALRLIDDDGLRLDLAHALRDVRDRLFKVEAERYPADFVDTVWWLYHHHEHVQRSETKVWAKRDQTWAPAAGGQNLRRGR
jgi:hypothetical protein